MSLILIMLCIYTESNWYFFRLKFVLRAIITVFRFSIYICYSMRNKKHTIYQVNLVDLQILNFKAKKKNSNIVYIIICVTQNSNSRSDIFIDTKFSASKCTKFFTSQATIVSLASFLFTHNTWIYEKVMKCFQLCIYQKFYKSIDLQKKKKSSHMYIHQIKNIKAQILTVFI